MGLLVGGSRYDYWDSGLTWRGCVERLWIGGDGWECVLSWRGLIDYNTKLVLV